MKRGLSNSMGQEPKTSLENKVKKDYGNIAGIVVLKDEDVDRKSVV